MNKSMTKLKITLLVLTVIAVVCLFSTQSLANEDSDQPENPSNAVTVMVESGSENYIELITDGTFAGATNYSIDNSKLTFKNASSETIATYNIKIKDKKYTCTWKVNGVEKYETSDSVNENDSFVASGKEDNNPYKLHVVIDGQGTLNPSDNPIVFCSDFGILGLQDKNIIMMHDSSYFKSPDRDFNITATPGENETFDHFEVNGEILDEGGASLNPGDNTLTVKFKGPEEPDVPGGGTSDPTEVAKTSDSTTMPGIIGLAAIGICAAGILIIRRKFN